MELTPQQQQILDGSQGPTMAKVMKTLVMYGQTFGADKLVPVISEYNHLVTSFGLKMMTPVFQLMQQLIDAGAVSKQQFSVDPRPLDANVPANFLQKLVFNRFMYATQDAYEQQLNQLGLMDQDAFTCACYANVPANFLQKLVFNRFMYATQDAYEQQLNQLGLMDQDAFTCACYLDQVGNKPRQGDVLSWAESSAVVYANSVLGARCNRNSGIMDIMGSIAGFVPHFGLLTDQGRKASWIVEVRCTKKPEAQLLGSASGIMDIMGSIAGFVPHFGLLTDQGRKASWIVEVRCTKKPEAQLLGSAIGMKVMEDVPYITGMEPWLGTELTDSTCAYLKDFGSATASNGAVGLYHMEHLTPEAKEQGRDLLLPDAQVYVIDDAELERVQRSYPLVWKNPDAKPKLCFIGCPHLSMEQLVDWTVRLERCRHRLQRRCGTVPHGAPDPRSQGAGP